MCLLIDHDLGEGAFLLETLQKLGDSPVDTEPFVVSESSLLM